MDEIQPYESGFFIAPNEVFDIEGLNVREKLVLYYLVRCANNHSKAFPSYNTIARKCSVSRVTAIETVKSLVSKKLLAKVERKNDAGDQTSNLYKVIVGSKEALPGSTGHVPPPSTPHVPPSTGDVPYKELPIKNYDSKKEYIYLDDLPHVQITADEMDKLVKLIGSKEDVTDYLYRFGAWIPTRPPKVQKTASAYLTVRNWYRKDAKNAPKPKVSNVGVKNENRDETEAFEAAYGQLFKKS